MNINKHYTIWYTWLNENRYYWILLLLAALGLTLGRFVLMWNQAPVDLKTLTTLLAYTRITFRFGHTCHSISHN